MPYGLLSTPEVSTECSSGDHLVVEQTGCSSLCPGSSCQGPQLPQHSYWWKHTLLCKPKDTLGKFFHKHEHALCWCKRASKDSVIFTRVTKSCLKTKIKLFQSQVTELFSLFYTYINTYSIYTIFICF